MVTATATDETKETPLNHWIYSEQVNGLQFTCNKQQQCSLASLGTNLCQFIWLHLWLNQLRLLTVVDWLSFAAYTKKSTSLHYLDIEREKDAKIYTYVNTLIFIVFGHAADSIISPISISIKIIGIIFVIVHHWQWAFPTFWLSARFQIATKKNRKKRNGNRLEIALKTNTKYMLEIISYLVD